MSNFPAVLDDDTTLYVARDNISTKLSASQSITDNVAVVASGAGWAPNMIASIGTEQEFVLGVVGNLLEVARAFGGTVASAHASGSLVSNNVDAAYQSSAKSAIIAIETALGANLANVPAAPVKYSNLYNFAPVTPGGSLAAGANTITFPLPPGITADSVGSAQLYISGGVGSAEVVPVIGVAAGAVTVTCLNTHSGAWTIQSATSGVQEAVIATAGYGQVQIASGIIPFQNSAGASTVTGCVTVPGNYIVSIRGLGKGITDIRCGGLIGNRIFFKSGSGSYVDVGDFTIRNVSAVMHTADAMLRVDRKTYGSMSDIEVENGFIGIEVVSCQNVPVRDCVVGAQVYPFYITSLGVNIGGGGMSTFDLTNCRGSSVGATSTSYRIEGPVSGSTMTACSGGAVTPGSSNQALLIIYDSTLGGQELSFNGCIFDAGGIGVQLQGDGVSYPASFYIFEGCECAGHEYGLFVDGKMANIHWNGGLIKGGGGTVQQGIFLRSAQNIQIQNVSVECLGVDGITVDTVTDVLFNAVSVGKNNSTPTNALAFGGPAVRMVIQNSDFGACTNKIVSPGTAANPLKLVNNVGIDDVIPTISSSAAIAQPVNLSAYVTGTVTITTITPIGVIGTRLRLIKKDGGSLTVGGGGNIPGTHTMAQNTSLDLEWDGSGWY